LLLEEVEGFVGTFICQKPPVLAAPAMAEDKHQEVEALRHAVYPMLTFTRLLGCVGEVSFRVKKLSNGIKDLKTVRSKAQ
jgi:hypothetical protein